MEFQIRSIVIGALIPILVPLLLSLSTTKSTKILAVLLAIILASSIVPLYPLAGNPNDLYSLFNFIFQKGNNAFAIMLFSYFASLICLIIPGKKLDRLSLGLFIFGFISYIVGMFSGDFEILVFNPIEYGQKSQIASLIWAALYFLLPIITFAFFIPQVVSEKSRKKELQRIASSRREVSKIPVFDQLKPLIFTAIAVVIYGVTATYFYDKLHCSGSEECMIWGSYFSRSAGFYLVAFFFFVTLFISLGTDVLKKESRGAKYLLIPAFLLLIIGTYASFQTYVKTNNEDIESRDFINEYIGDIKKVSVRWEDVKGYGIQTQKNDGKCLSTYPYLILNDDKPVELSTIVGQGTSFRLNYQDNNFIDYLSIQKKLPLLKTNLNEC